MKGIILAGGKGTRLYPASLHINKQLLPIYDKPMIYYPLSILMEAGIDEIMIITRKQDKPSYDILLGDGSQLGLKIQYTIQENPNGIAEAFIIAEDFIGDRSVMLILGDNIFHGSGLVDEITEHCYNNSGATIFSYEVQDPERYGVVETDEFGEVLSLVEKPTSPVSNKAVTGLYVYNNDVIKIAKGLKPSVRGELEITDVNKEYLKREQLEVCHLNVGNVWLDTGTFDSLAEASEYVKAIQKRTGKKIACIEEIALDYGLIEEDDFIKLAHAFCGSSEYGMYLRKIAERI
jgi:glucose-1-phosphate thymidylyltransferase